MSKSAATMALGVLLAISLSVGTAMAHEGSGPPPKDLKFVNGHWTPWDPPEAAEGAYIVQKGDTLWDLATEWLGDPYLWPQVWDENRYILDSHWIYPGDPLVIPGRPQVVPEGGPPPGSEEPDEPVEPDEPIEPDLPYQDTSPPKPTPVPTIAPLQPVADAQDIYCSGFIDVEHEFSDLWVAGNEHGDNKLHFAGGDVIFLSQGRNQGLQPGDTFALHRATRDVSHPATGDPVGQFVRRLGKVRVLLTQENTSTAVIAMSCEDIQSSDELVPWNDIAVPMRREMPKFDRLDTEPSGGASGHVVFLADDRMSVAEGHIVHTDLGIASGVNPGDMLTVYRDVEELPRTVVAQAIVLTVEGTTSTVKLTANSQETFVGDRVEVQ
jgi:hypothetical protein